MSNRTFNRKQALEHEVKDIYLNTTYTDGANAVGTLNLTDDIVLTKAAGGSSNNGATFTTEVIATAGNPTNTVLAVFTGGANIVCTVTPNSGVNNPTAAAVGTLDLTADIVLTKVALGATHNGDTFTLNIQPAAANPTDTLIAVYSGTSNNAVLTITPNDGTNNSATPVDLTTAELVEFINTTLVTGKTVTITDASNLKSLLTATGGDTTPLADSGEGDGVVATFAGGANTAVYLTTANLVELINTGAVSGKNVTLTDSSALRTKQTATGGGSANMINSGEGDSVVATFAGGTSVFTNVANQSKWGIKSIAETAIGTYRIVLSDKFLSLKYFNCKVLATVAKDLTAQLKAEDVNGAVTPYIDFYLHSGATLANPATGSQLKIVIELKNTTVI